MTNSEFGKGFTYNIGMFIAHEKGIKDWQELQSKSLISEGAQMFFYEASDHLFELTLPKKIKKELRLRIKNWQHKCLNWRGPNHPLDTTFNNPTFNDAIWAIDEGKEILRLWDEKCGIKTIKGDFE